MKNLNAHPFLEITFGYFIAFIEYLDSIVRKCFYVENQSLNLPVCMDPIDGFILFVKGVVNTMYTAIFTVGRNYGCFI